MCSRVVAVLCSVYYVSASASRADQQLLSVKLPFRVRTSPPYHDGHADDAAVVQLPLPLVATSTIEHRRLHPPPEPHIAQPGDTQAVDTENTQTVPNGTAAGRAEQSDNGEQPSHKTSFIAADDGELLSPPPRQVFPVATLQRSFSSSSSRPHLHILTSSHSLLPDAVSSLLTDLEPATPPTPPTPDYRAIRTKIHQLRLSQLKNEPAAFPSCLPSPQLLAAFHSAIRTPLSFNISEQSQHSAGASPVVSLHVTNIRLERSAFRPGDTIRLLYDFSAAALPTYRAWLSLDWVEAVVGGGRHVHSVASSHVYCLSAVEVPLSVQLPREATCNWASSLMRGEWRLVFHFVIGRPRSFKAKPASGGWWLVGTADAEEERVERERMERDERRRAEAMLLGVEGRESAVSSASMALLCAGDPSLQVSCLQWELPLNVVPLYDDTEPMPATKSAALDVAEWSSMAELDRRRSGTLFGLPF